MGDQRLKEIKNFKGATPLSDFVYAYNPTGTIKTWQQQQDALTPTVYQLSYDAADQLIGAVQKKTTDQSTVTSNLYNYDPAGNRLAEKTLTGTTAGQFNNLNQLIATTSNVTNQTVTGSVSKPVVKVEINSIPATLTNGTNFTANVPLPAGTNVVSVVAQDAQATTQTNRSSTLTSGPTPTKPTYDLNGNTTKDEKGYVYTWDALNRLKTITYPNGNKSLFAYDGLSRRVQIVETGTTSSTKNYLWLGTEIVEERDTTNTVQKRFLPQGEQQAGVSYYYTRDHLGSVREVVNNSGAIQARYDYDPYGRTTLIQGTNLADFQYARYYTHQPSGLNLTKYRAYDSDKGRWLSRDPIAEKGGINIFEYVGDNPVNKTDPNGLCPCGQHLEWSLETYNDTVSMLNGGTVGDFIETGAGFGLGLGSVGAREAASFGASVSSIPITAAGSALGAWALGTRLGAALGSWECVDDSYHPPSPGVPGFVPPGENPWNANSFTG